MSSGKLRSARRTIQLAVVASAGLGFSLMLTGCTATPNEPSATDQPAVQGNQRDYDNSMIIAACLEDRGWDVEVTPTGGWGVEAEVPQEQMSAYQADYEECVSEAGLDNVEMTEELANEVYDNNLRVIGCLTDNGYSTEEPPARDSFVAKIIENPDGDFWNPYSLVAENEMPNAVLTCPQ